MKDDYIVTPNGLIPADELMHYGVLGMRWGVRRYQNPDGSLTSAGRKRYQLGTNGKISNAKGAKKFLNDSDISISKARYEGRKNADKATELVKKAHKRAEKIAKKTGDNSVLDYDSARNHPKLKKLMDKAEKYIADAIELDSYAKQGEAFMQQAVSKLESAGYTVSSKDKKRLVDVEPNPLYTKYTFEKGNKYNVKDTLSKDERKLRNSSQNAIVEKADVVNKPKVLDKPVIVNTGKSKTQSVKELTSKGYKEEPGTGGDLYTKKVKGSTIEVSNGDNDLSSSRISERVSKAESYAPNLKSQIEKMAAADDYIKEQGVKAVSGSHFVYVTDTMGETGFRGTDGHTYSVYFDPDTGKINDKHLMMNG